MLASDFHCKENDETTRAVNFIQTFLSKNQTLRHMNVCEHTVRMAPHDYSETHRGFVNQRSMNVCEHTVWMALYDYSKTHRGLCQSEEHEFM